MEARQGGCTANLHIIGLALEMYSMDKDGYPADLDALYPDCIGSLRTFECPSAPERRASHPGLEDSGSYRYVGAVHGGGGPAVIVAYDKAGNHVGGRNVVFADCHVGWIGEAELAGRLAESLTLVKAGGWDKYPEELQRRIEAFYTPDKGP
jgi:prepilin-type processing-associated H-X9-DG protein